MNRNGSKILAHIGCWLLFILLIAAFLNNSSRDSNNWLQTIFSLSFLLFILFYAFIFYVNLYVLMPYLFLKKKYAVYTIIAITLLAACFYIKPFEQIIQYNRINMPPQTGEINNRDMPPPPFMNRGNRPEPPAGALINRPPAEAGQLRIDIVSLILFFMAMAGSAMLVLSKQWRITEKNRSQVEIQKIKAELAFLKTQISPHFLFNTLNNIYALAITKNENTASGILRLSNIMRYVTDEAKEDFVPVEKEIACINDFIALQKLRLGKKVTLDYTLTGEYGNIKVAPLILMAFIENTFKHGVSNHMPARISIAITINERGISLRTQNMIMRKGEENNRKGVGLFNARQRLELLYPGAHELQVSSNNEIFTVDLVLDNVPA